MIRRRLCHFQCLVSIPGGRFRRVHRSASCQIEAPSFSVRDVFPNINRASTKARDHKTVGAVPKGQPLPNAMERILEVETRASLLCPSSPWQARSPKRLPSPTGSHQRSCLRLAHRRIDVRRGFPLPSYRPCRVYKYWVDTRVRYMSIIHT